ncbi:MAG: DegV family protein, partial [Lachnospiraceae bacterium]|nr:DegV family protein [Lachnospiraceae bacterium]
MAQYTKKWGSNMSDFKIITNTTADLPQSFIEDNGLGLFFFNYTLNGQVYSADNDLDYKIFYSKVR